MTIWEMQYEFERLLETIYPDAKIEDKQDSDTVLLALNISQRRFLYEKYLSKSTIKENIEYLQKRSDDLRNLIVRGELMSPTAINTGPLSAIGYTIDLSTLANKYLFYLRSDTLLTRSGPPVVGPTASWTTNKIVNSYEEINKIVTTIFNKPLLREPVVALESANKLLLVTDNFTTIASGVNSNTIAITYLKFPKDLGFTNEITISTCELSEHTHEEIVRLAVDIYVKEYKFLLSQKSK